MRVKHVGVLLHTSNTPFFPQLIFLTGVFLSRHGSFIENTSGGQLGLDFWNLSWLNSAARLYRCATDLICKADSKTLLPYSYTYHIYRALRANAKWGHGCEFYPCPLLAWDLAPVPLSPMSCAAAQQRWVTPVSE